MSEGRGIIERMSEQGGWSNLPKLSGSPYARDMSATSEQAALVALLRVRPERMSWPQLTAEVLDAGSAAAVWKRLVPATLLGEDREELDKAAADVDRWLAEGLTFLTILDEQYPERLRAIHEAPPVLFARGILVPGDQAVSVVGSRKASPRGLSIATGVASALVGEGITVASGLALGIDAAAHTAALAAGGRTVAMIGTGINRTYPAANRQLHRDVADRGLLLSQFWPDAPPQRHTFLMRNATMSGYGLATVVVEAGETSGARAQARMAVEHGRPVILTDLVVERNEWAQVMVGRAGVHVASGLADVMDIIRDLVATTDDVTRTLRDLVDA
jgi:DNA processing protein